jgi:hypothetical protein
MNSMWHCDNPAESPGRRSNAREESDDGVDAKSVTWSCDSNNIDESEESLENWAAQSEA